MSKKRRDSKNRILQSGESQRKDGRYAYKYIDAFGKPQFVYAWKLVPTDKTPAGKREDLSLREKIKEIRKDLDDGIDPVGKKMTVCELYAKYTRHRGNVKQNTINGRRRLMNILEQDRLGACSIDSVKMSDAKEWALRMRDKGIVYKTINNDRRSLCAAFHTAIQDDCIRKNPFDFKLNTVLEDDTEPKTPLTPAQEASLLSFVQADPVYQKYYDELVILLGTGLRISELCGLTDSDLDFESRTVNVNHQLLRDAKIGYYITEPKTDSGKRQIPMSEAVYQAFQRVQKRHRSTQPFIVGGYNNFLFLTNEGKPKTASGYGSMFRGLVKKYNKSHPEALPKSTTPHTLHHTFCTNLANAGINPKALQYIMGHASITMTVNIKNPYEQLKSQNSLILYVKGGEKFQNFSPPNLIC